MNVPLGIGSMYLEFEAATFFVPQFLDTSVENHRCEGQGSGIESSKPDKRDSALGKTVRIQGPPGCCVVLGRSVDLKQVMTVKRQTTFQVFVPGIRFQYVSDTVDGLEVESGV